MTEDDLIEAVGLRVSRARLASTEVVTCATEFLSFDESKSAALMFRMLNHGPPADVTSNLLDVFGELARRNPRWVSILEKSIQGGRGRCPKKLRSTIRKILDRDHAVQATTTENVLEADVFADLDVVVSREQSIDYKDGAAIRIEKTSFLSGRRRAIVSFSRDLSDIRRMEAVAVLLNRLESEKFDEIVLDLSQIEHIYVVGLAAIFVWFRQRGIRPILEGLSPRTRQYLERLRFLNDETPSPAIVPEQDFWTLTIESIEHDGQPEKLSARLTDMIAHHMPISGTDRSALIVLFAELIENVNRHAGPETPAVACAQVYPKQNKLTLCVADLGIGLRESIATGSNPDLIRRLERGEPATLIATAPLTTSKPGKHSGYGLYVASELTVRNGGTFRIFSGREILTIYRRGSTRMIHRVQVPCQWNGTWIAMLLDLNTVLPIRDVYATLPPAPGKEVEDYF